MNDVSKVRAGVVVLAVAIVAACTVGPEYRRPQVVSVDEFVGAGGRGSIMTRSNANFGEHSMIRSSIG